MLVGEPSGGVERAAVEQRAAQDVGGGVIEIGVAEPGGDGGPGARGGGVRRERRLLALAQVGGRGLARDRRVAEHAQDVVGDLEGDAHESTVSRERADRALARSGEHRTGGERALEGVHGGLLLERREHPADLGRLGGGGVHDVGELARRGDEHGPVEDVEQGGAAVGGNGQGRDLAVGPAQREVAGQHRGGLAPDLARSLVGAVRARTIREARRDVRRAAPHGVAVDHVVVDEERRVQQFEGQRHARGECRVGAAQSRVGRVHEARADPLAARALQFERLPQRGVVHAERARPRAGIGEERPKPVVDRGVDEIRHGRAPAPAPGAPAMG